MFEPFLDPWVRLTWLMLLVLWIAAATQGWLWLPLAALGLSGLAIQVWMAIRSAWIGVQDGQIGGLGAIAGALSFTQIGLTIVWIALIARSKRMPA
jgi:hypothetical protein